MYKVEAFIEKCLLSCVTQDILYNEYEIICVNDGSPDSSGDIAKRFARNYNNIMVIDQPNGGLSTARNTGMRNASGEYYMFVDSDDWIADNCLGKLTKRLIADKPDALAICASNVINGENRRRQSYFDETPVSGKTLLEKGIQPNAWLAIWSATFFKKHNFSFYEGIFHEDSELTPRAYYYADKVSLCNDICYYVRQNPDSIMRSVNPQKSFDLINVVCPHLSDFANQVEDKYKVIFYNMVGMYLNNAMAFILMSPKDKQEELNELLIRNKHLWSDLRKSSVFKYRLEARLVAAFPKYPLGVYKFLGILKK